MSNSACGAAGANILVVDDTPANVRLLQDILSKQGYEVRVALNGEEALASISDSPPNLILLDIMMPDMDGFAVCNALKAESGIKDIPVIFISSLDDPKSKIMAFSKGGVDYISKPFQAEEVLARVKTHLDLQYLHQSLREQNEQLQRQAQQLRIIDELQSDFITANASGDIYARMLDSVRATTGSTVAFLAELNLDKSNTPAMIVYGLGNADGRRLGQPGREQGFEGLEIKNLNTLIGSVFTTREAVICNAPSPDPNDVGLPPGHSAATSFMGIPIYSGERLVGELGLANRAGGYDTPLLLQLLPLARTCGQIIVAQRERLARYRLETDLRRARQLADAANAAKSNFLANMSHEIRTPLNGSLGMLQLLRRTTLDSRQADYVAKAETAAKSLLSLLNDILDYSKIEAGKMELDAHAFNFEALMQELATVLTGAAANKAEVEIAFDIDASLPSTLIGDRLRLLQIFINLVGNALKFTERGHVIVSVKKLGMAQDLVTIQFTIDDTGIGISPEQQTRIFEGFTQAEASITRRYGGTGLGLVISQRLIDLMGGQLKVESQPNQGSRFWFALEFGVAQEREHSQTVYSYKIQPNVLVVDDNPRVGGILTHSLQSMGYCAEFVECGYTALARIEASAREGRAFDVVLMDWKMPGIDGLSTANLIRNSNFEKPPRVIMLTEHGRQDLIDARTSNPPFVDFLNKPVTPLQLSNVISKMLQLTHQAPTIEPTGAGRLQGLKILVVEDNPLNSQVISELLLSEGAEVIRAENGVIGVAKVQQQGNNLDLVFMDVQMPEMDGLQATRLIRAQEQFLHLPIVAMTANASLADKNACIEAGMNCHISKPIDFDSVMNHVLALVGRANANSSDKQPQESALDKPQPQCRFV